MLKMISRADPDSLVQGGSTQLSQCFFFQLMRGKRIQKPLKAGNHWPVSEMPFKRRFAGRQMMTHH